MLEQTVMGESGWGDLVYVDSCSGLVGVIDVINQATNEVV